MNKVFKPVVAIRDQAMAAFQNPIAVNAVGLAVRSFGDEVNNPESPMNAHPEDYELFKLADYDEETGRLIPLDSPESLVRGKDVIRPRS